MNRYTWTFVSVLLGLTACSTGGSTSKPNASSSVAKRSGPLTTERTRRLSRKLGDAGQGSWSFEADRRGMVELRLCDKDPPTRLEVVARHTETDKEYSLEQRSDRCLSARWPVHQGERWEVDISGRASAEYYAVLELDDRAPDHPDLTEVERLSYTLEDTLAADRLKVGFRPQRCILQLDRGGQHEVVYHIPLRKVDVHPISSENTRTENAAIEFVCSEKRDCIYKVSTSWSAGTPHDFDRKASPTDDTGAPVQPAALEEALTTLQKLIETCDPPEDRTHPYPPPL